MLLYGLLQVLGARCLRLLRALLTAEVCGIAILMLGIALLRMALPKFIGFDAALPAISPSACTHCRHHAPGHDRRPPTWPAIDGRCRARCSASAPATPRHWHGRASRRACRQHWPRHRSWLGPNWPRRPSRSMSSVDPGAGFLLLALVAIVDSAGVVIATDRLSSGNCRTAGQAARGGIAGVGLASAMAALIGAMPCATSTAYLGLARRERAAPIGPSASLSAACCSRRRWPPSCWCCWPTPRRRSSAPSPPMPRPP